MPPTLLSNVEVVLVGTAEPMNLGAAARAMKNCGLSRLTLVAPRTSDLVTARRVAVHAEELLAAPRAVPTLGEAVADAVWVVGTSSRTLPGPRPLTPREVGARTARLAGEGKVALVFGCEASGLSNEELLRCHAQARIPTDDAQPSVNLAQAVLLFAYEAMLAAGADPVPPEAPRAPDAEVAALEAPLRRALTASGFADLDRPRHGVPDLLQTLRRAGLSPDEARLWKAALWALAKAQGGGRTAR